MDSVNPDDIPIKPMQRNQNEFSDMFLENQENQEEMIKEEEAKPIEERVISKFICVKKNALSEIFEKIKKFSSPNDSVFTESLNLIQIALEDRNPLIVESGLDIIVFIFNNCENKNEIISIMFKKIVEKCYSSSRNSLNKKAKEFLLNAYENSVDPKGLFEHLKTLLESKSLKTFQVTLNFITHLLSLFGSFNIEYRAILPILEKFSDDNSTSILVKKEILEFYKELYKWIRGNVRSSINKLKSGTQVK